MSLFIKTESGRLQNLLLLQDVRVTDNSEYKFEDEDLKYFVAYVQSNGEIITEGEYSTKEDAESAVENVKNSLTGEPEQE